MGDVTIKCGVATGGAKGHALGGATPTRGLIVCPRCSEKSMVRLETAITNNPAVGGAAIKERVYECTTPGCMAGGRQTLVRTTETSEGETIKAYV